MADVHHVQQQVRLNHFFERRLERLDKSMRQLANETDRVGEQHVLVGRQAQPARGGVERGEQFVFLQDFRAGEGVEQRGFAGVRIADNRGQRPELTLSARALCRALAPYEHQFLANLVNSLLHPAAIRFELRLAFAAAHADAAFLP